MSPFSSLGFYLSIGLTIRLAMTSHIPRSEDSLNADTSLLNIFLSPDPDILPSPISSSDRIDQGFSVSSFDLSFSQPPTTAADSSGESNGSDEPSTAVTKNPCGNGRTNSRLRTRGETACKAPEVDEESDQSATLSKPKDKKPCTFPDFQVHLCCPGPGNNLRPFALGSYYNEIYWCVPCKSSCADKLFPLPNEDLTLLHVDVLGCPYKYNVCCQDWAVSRIPQPRRVLNQKKREKQTRN